MGQEKNSTESVQEAPASTQRTEPSANAGNNFAARTRAELMDVAKRLHITGRNGLSKRELLAVIENRSKPAIRILDFLRQ
jgi:hypothetical protein